MSQAVDLAQKLDLFTHYWSPKIVSQFNGHDIMVAKLEGEFTWYHHDDTDDFFFVVSGHLTIELEVGRVDLGPGELYVIPKGVRHRPVGPWRGACHAHREGRHAKYGRCGNSR